MLLVEKHFVQGTIVNHLAQEIKRDIGHAVLGGHHLAKVQ
jgi:hypothetical protein